MATVTVPDGFAAVVVLIAKSDKDDRVEIQFANEDVGSEHTLVADAIAALAVNQADVIEDLITEDDEEEEEDEEEQEPEEQPS